METKNMADMSASPFPFSIFPDIYSLTKNGDTENCKKLLTENDLSINIGGYTPHQTCIGLSW
jgi:hypothetical protein